MRVKVDIEARTFVRLLLVTTAFVVAVFMLTRLHTALMILGIAAFLALALNPPVSELAKRLPGHSRVLATALSYIMVLAVVGMFIYIALPPIIDQTNKFIGSLPRYIQNLSAQQGVVADIVTRYSLQDELNELVHGAQQQAAGLAQGIGGSVINGISSVLTGFVTLLMVLVLAFLMLIEGPLWFDRLWSLYYDKHKLKRHQELAVKMYKVVTSYVNGQVLVASVAAAAGLTALLILTYLFNVPIGAVIPLTGIIFLTDLIPMVGATIGAVIVTLVLLLNDFGAGLVFVIYFILYQQIENNFIQPLVQSRSVALTPLSIFVSIIIGISLLGVIGGVVAIPIAGCIRILVIDYLQHRRPPKAASERHGVWHRLVSKATTTD